MLNSMGVLCGGSAIEAAKVSLRAGVGGAGSLLKCLCRYKCEGCLALGRLRRTGTAGEPGEASLNKAGGHKSSTIFCFLVSARRAAGISVE